MNREERKKFRAFLEGNGKTPNTAHDYAARISACEKHFATCEKHSKAPSLDGIASAQDLEELIAHIKAEVPSCTGEHQTAANWNSALKQYHLFKAAKLSSIPEIRVCIEKILTEYKKARTETYSGHPLAIFIKNEFQQAIEAIIPSCDRLTIKENAGQSEWARSPYLAILDRVVTDTDQCGYYPVYLFREDMEGVYLSLNQDVTKIKENNKIDLKMELKKRANFLRTLLGSRSDSNTFKELEIDLNPMRRLSM